MQQWAARLELVRARQRLVWFLLIDAILCWALALVVVVARPGGGLATAALALAVLAEVSLSVLYATARQPLPSLVLGAVGRQQVNAQGRSVGLALMVAVATAGQDPAADRHGRPDQRVGVAAVRHLHPRRPVARREPRHRRHGQVAGTVLAGLLWRATATSLVRRA